MECQARNVTASVQSDHLGTVYKVDELQDASAEVLCTFKAEMVQKLLEGDDRVEPLARSRTEPLVGV